MCSLSARRASGPRAALVSMLKYVILNLPRTSMSTVHPSWPDLLTWLSRHGMDVSPEKLPVEARSSYGSLSCRYLILRIQYVPHWQALDTACSPMARSNPPLSCFQYQQQLCWILSHLRLIILWLFPNWPVLRQFPCIFYFIDLKTVLGAPTPISAHISQFCHKILILIHWPGFGRMKTLILLPLNHSLYRPCRRRSSANWEEF